MSGLRVLLTEGSSPTSREMVTRPGRTGHLIEVADRDPLCISRGWPNRTRLGIDAAGPAGPGAAGGERGELGAGSGRPRNLSGSGSETHQHFSPANATCCQSLLFDPDATIGIGLRKRLFLLVADEENSPRIFITMDALYRLS